jgi:hypothetical protein
MLGGLRVALAELAADMGNSPDGRMMRIDDLGMSRIPIRTGIAHIT